MFQRRSQFSNVLKFITIAGFLLLSTQVFAESERSIVGEEILQLLVNQKVIGKGFQQTFGDPRGHESASTTYWEGSNQSLGRWKVEGNRYCSQWGQNAAWACYKMAMSELDGETHVVWIDESGRRFEGVLQLPQ